MSCPARGFCSISHAFGRGGGCVWSGREVLVAERRVEGRGGLEGCLGGVPSYLCPARCCSEGREPYFFVEERGVVSRVSWRWS